MHVKRATGCGVVLLGLLATPATAQQVQPQPFIKAEGVASADVVPDIARLSIGVVAERATAAAAIAEVAKAAQAVVDEVKAQGIADKDVMTGSIVLTPIVPDEAVLRAGKPQAKGFRASTDLTVTVTPADRAGAVASRLVDSGANVIDGIAYSSSQETKLLDDLRADATRDARRKAEIYVGALGLHLGRVLEIEPGYSNGEMPLVFARSAGSMPTAAPAPPIPVKPGALTVRANVSVRWEIVQ